MSRTERLKRLLDLTYERRSRKYAALEFRLIDALDEERTREEWAREAAEDLAFELWRDEGI